MLSSHKMVCHLNFPNVRNFWSLISQVKRIYHLNLKPNSLRTTQGMKNGTNRLCCSQLLLLASSSCWFPSLFFIHRYSSSKWRPWNSLHLFHETEGQKRNSHFPWVICRALPAGTIKSEHYQLKRKTDKAREENKEKWKQIKRQQKIEGKTRTEKDEGIETGSE